MFLKMKTQVQRQGLKVIIVFFFKEKYNENRT